MSTPDTKYDRFDLEEAVMATWSTQADIQLFVDALTNAINSADIDIADKDRKDLLDAVETLSGLATLHDLRSQKLFRVFEQMIEDRVIL